MVVAIQKATVRMGEWHTEVRAESVYVYGVLDAAREDAAVPDAEHSWRVSWRLAPADQPDAGDHAVALRAPVADASKVVAALDQVLGHGAYRDFAAEHPVHHGVWSRAQGEDGWLEFAGYFTAYGDRTPWAHHHMIELHYATLADLRDRIAEAAA